MRIDYFYGIFINFLIKNEILRLFYRKTEIFGGFDLKKREKNEKTRKNEIEKKNEILRRIKTRSRLKTEKSQHCL
jgi:hypothetical protein